MNQTSKNIEAYFIDLDGTLLDEKTEKGNYIVSKKNKEAIANAQKNNKKIIISTGRMGEFVLNIINDLNINYAVTGNGAIIINKNGKIIKSNPIKKEQFNLIIEILKKNKLCFKLNESFKAFGVISFKNKILTNKFLKYGFIPKNNYEFNLQRDFFKIVVWGDFKNKLDKVKKDLLKTISGLSVEKSSNGWSLEITHKDSTKGLGNLFIADKLKINREKIAHIGDTMNDSTTAKYMKLIAMKNSSRELKRLAAEIGPNWADGGIAKIID